MLMILTACVVLVISAVLVHLLAIEGLLTWLSRGKRLTRTRIGLLVFGAILAHLVEILLFAIGLAFFGESAEYGSVGGAASIDGKMDYFYFSAVTFTSLGYGDITPNGLLRILSAVEALTGLVLIAWTASTLFLVMERMWLKKDDASRRLLEERDSVTGE